MHKNTKHGLRKHELYQTWSGLKNRCNNKNSKDYHNYGARGISVCDEWNNSFQIFLDDMGERPTGMTIDRIDVNGCYCKENCRWANNETQSNNRRTTKYITYNGETLSYSQWSKKLGGNRTLVSYRIIFQGWDEVKAVSTPIDISKRNL